MSNKAVLLSVQPKWCELIATGKKTLKVCKTRPKIETPFKCYIYCTKDRQHFWTGKRYSYADDRSHNAFDRCGNGKVIGEFVCDEITTFPDKCSAGWLVNNSRVSSIELERYADGNDKLYAWHISDLVIYGEPKELSEFCCADNEAIKACKHRFIMGQPEYCTKHSGWIKGSYGCIKSGETEWCEKCHTKPLRRPPQSWCYVEEVSE